MIPYCASMVKVRPVWEGRWGVHRGRLEVPSAYPRKKGERERGPNESNLRKFWISHSLTLPPRLGVENAGVRVGYI